MTEFSHVGMGIAGSGMRAEMQQSFAGQIQSQIDTVSGFAAAIADAIKALSQSANDLKDMHESLKQARDNRNERIDARKSLEQPVDTDPRFQQEVDDGVVVDSLQSTAETGTGVVADLLERAADLLEVAPDLDTEAIRYEAPTELNQEAFNTEMSTFTAKVDDLNDKIAKQDSTLVKLADNIAAKLNDITSKGSNIEKLMKDMENAVKELDSLRSRAAEGQGSSPGQADSKQELVEAEKKVELVKAELKKELIRLAPLISNVTQDSESQVVIKPSLEAMEAVVLMANAVDPANPKVVGAGVTDTSDAFENNAKATNSAAFRPDPIRDAGLDVD